MKMYEFQLKLKFVPKSPIYHIPALVQTMALHWPGDKVLSEPMMSLSLNELIAITKVMTSTILMAITLITEPHLFRDINGYS